MKLKNTTILNIDAFRRNFSLEELIDLVNSETALRLWISQQKELPYPEEERELLRALETSITCWCSETENEAMTRNSAPSYLIKENKTAFELLLSKIPAGSEKLYWNGCYLFFLLVELGRHVLTPSETAELNHFLSGKFTLLRIGFSGGVPVLLCRARQMCPLSVPRTISGFPAMVTTEWHETSGFLGVDDKGRLVNGSRFHIAVPEKSVVKTQLNAMFYALLLEDGSVLHNLARGVPKALRAADISLNGEQLSYTSLEHGG